MFATALTVGSQEREVLILTSAVRDPTPLPPTLLPAVRCYRHSLTLSRRHPQFDHFTLKTLAERVRFELTGLSSSGFQDRRNRPLCHLSVGAERSLRVAPAPGRPVTVLLVAAPLDLSNESGPNRLRLLPIDQDRPSPTPIEGIGRSYFRLSRMSCALDGRDRASRPPDRPARRPAVQSSRRVSAEHRLVGGVFCPKGHRRTRQAIGTPGRRER